MKVLFVAAEAVPFAKTGGLADVAGSLPKELRNQGVDVRVIMPKFGKISEEFRQRPFVLDPLREIISPEISIEI